MKNNFIGVLLLVTLLFTACEPKLKVEYPNPQKGNVVDDYHGTEVSDPYRWMENLDDTNVSKWVTE